MRFIQLPVYLADNNDEARLACVALEHVAFVKPTEKGCTIIFDSGHFARVVSSYGHVMAQLEPFMMSEQWSMSIREIKDRLLADGWNAWKAARMRTQSKIGNGSGSNNVVQNTMWRI